MKARLIVSTMFFTFLFSSTYALEPGDNTSSLNVRTIENYLGKKGRSNADANAYRILIPRDDLEILINGMKVMADRSLTSRLEFKKSEEDDETSLSGDLILSQDQVNPVMSVVLNQGLEVTDLHSPFLWDSPRVMVMHIHGIGSEAKLAKGLNKVLYAIKATMHGQGDFPLVSLGETETDLNVMSINNILGTKGVLSSGAYKVSFENERINNPVSKAIARNSWASFSGSNSETLLDGTVAVKEAELQMVLRALRNSQVYVLSIYQHIIDDDPNYVFVHYWGVGDSRKLARAIRTTMLTAENHIEKNENFFVEKQNKVSTFLPQQACNNPKPLALTDNDIKKTTSELHPVKVVNVFEMMKSGMEKALAKTESKANYFLVNFATTWITGHITSPAKPRTSKVTVTQDTVLPKEFYNNGLIEKQISNTFLWKVSTQNHASFIHEKNYNYVSQLVNAHPVVFDEPQQAAQQKQTISLYKEEVNNLLHKVFSKKESDGYNFGVKSQPKNFNYFVQLKNAHPISMGISVPEMPVLVSAKNSPVTKVMPAMHTEIAMHEFDNKMQLLHAIQIALGVRSIPENNFQLRAPKKQYNYVAELQQTHPVLFSKAEPTQIAIRLEARGVAVVKSNQTFDFHNDAKLKEVVTFMLGMKMPRQNSLILRTGNKNYNYLSQAETMHPIVFPKEDIVAAKPMLAADFHNNAKIVNALENTLGIRHVIHDNLILRAENKNFNYITEIQKTHPIIFVTYPEPTVQAQATSKTNLTQHAMQTKQSNRSISPLAMNNFHNDDKLTKAVLSAFRKKQDKPEPNILGQVNRAVALKNYHPVLLAENTRSTLPIPISEMATNIKSDISPAAPGNVIPIKTPVTKASILKAYPEEVIIPDKIKPVKIASRNKPIVLADAISRDIANELNAKINKSLPSKKTAFAPKLIKAFAAKKVSKPHLVSKTIITHKLFAKNPQAHTPRTGFQKQKTKHYLAVKKYVGIQHHVAVLKHKPIHHIALQSHKIVKHSDPIQMMAKQEPKPILPSHAKIQENDMPFDGLSE